MGSGHSQGRRFTSRQASHRISSDTRKRISSATGKRKSYDELLDLDEEMSGQLFLQENPGMDLESLMKEKARLKAEERNRAATSIQKQARGRNRRQAMRDAAAGKKPKKDKKKGKKKKKGRK